MMYSKFKLCIQNNLPNITKVVFFFFLNFFFSSLGFEYRIKEMKSDTSLFETKQALTV